MFICGSGGGAFAGRAGRSGWSGVTRTAACGRRLMQEGLLAMKTLALVLLAGAVLLPLAACDDYDHGGGRYHHHDHNGGGGHDHDGDHHDHDGDHHDH